MPDSPETPPYGSYAVLVGTFGAAMTGVSLLARALGREPRELTAFDVLALGGATFKASRTLARDEVTSFVRAPFVVGEAHDGEDEEPTGEGMQRALGELLTCSRCVGIWVAGGLAATQLLAPRFGRLLVWALNGAALNDYAQASFTALTAKSNELEQRAN